MLPLLPSVIVNVDEAVPEFVLKIRSDAPPVVSVNVPAPLEVIVAAAPESPTVVVSPARTISPVPCQCDIIICTICDYDCTRVRSRVCR